VVCNQFQDPLLQRKKIFFLWLSPIVSIAIPCYAWNDKKLSETSYKTLSQTSEVTYSEAF
jgi:hypothetical protein